MQKILKPVYLYDLEGNLLRKFNSTKECGEYFGYELAYICHNLKYCKKIRYNNSKWYIISRKNKLEEENNGKV